MPDAANPSACPPEADLVAYCESRSTDYFAAYMEKHLVYCSTCARKVTDHARKQAGDRQSKPKELSDWTTTVYVRGYFAALTRDHVLIVGHKQYGWDVVVEGPHPLRFDFAFHSDDNAKQRGYEMARQHLLSQGVTHIAEFSELQWDDWRIGGDGATA